MLVMCFVWMYEKESCFYLLRTKRRYLKIVIIKHTSINERKSRNIKLRLQQISKANRRLFQTLENML